MSDCQQIQGFFGGNESVLALDSASGYKTLSINYHQIVHFMRVNFVVCELYLDLKNKGKFEKLPHVM